MGLYTATNLPADGETIDAADVNTDMQGLIDEFNGAVDNDNIAANAEIDISKINLGGGGSAWATWTPTVVGFSGTPTVVARYKKIGKTVFCRLRVDGTSNATSFTVTLPLKHNVNASIYAVGRTQDNTTSFDWGFLIIVANATTTTACQIYRAVNTSGWTAANTKSFHGIFFYETE